jgi:hypothetical protein
VPKNELSEAEHRFREIHLEKMKLVATPMVAAVIGVGAYLFVDSRDLDRKEKELDVSAQKLRSERATEFLKLYLNLPEEQFANRLELLRFIPIVADPQSDESLLVWAKTTLTQLAEEVERRKETEAKLEKEMLEAETDIVAAKADEPPPSSKGLTDPAAVEARSKVLSAVSKAGENATKLARIQRSLEKGPIDEAAASKVPKRYDGPVETLSESPSEARSFSVFRRPFCVASKSSGGYAYCHSDSLQECRQKLGKVTAGMFKEHHECVERAATVHCYAWSTRDGVGPLASCFPTSNHCESGRTGTLLYPEAAAVTTRCTPHSG